jgi:hypothetical protein
MAILLTACFALGVRASVPNADDELSRHFDTQDGTCMPRDVRVGELCCEYFLYFMTDSTDRATRLVLHVQYCADDPLRYRDVAFIVDGDEYHITTARAGLKRFKRRYYMEVSDTPLDSSDTPLLNALLDGDNITVRLTGAGGMGHVMRLEPRQCDNIKRAIALYRLQGGQL